MRTWPAALLLLVACQTPAPAPTKAKGAVEAPVEEEGCTFATPLVPGIPGSPGHLLPSTINPNGQSELAAHMRMMLADLKAARKAMEAGEPVAPLRARHNKLRCAWPTVASDRTEKFDTLAEGYLLGVTMFDEAPPDQKKAAFNEALKGCRECHEKGCSPAMAAIKDLPFTL